MSLHKEMKKFYKEPYSIYFLSFFNPQNKKNGHHLLQSVLALNTKLIANVLSTSRDILFSV